LQDGKTVKVVNITKGETYETEHSLSERQMKMILAGSLINLVRKEM
jgi:aconitate hydratase